MPSRAPSLSRFFVVFDTSTQPEYYADVHRVLALPAGAVIPYEYPRYLYTSGAANALDALVEDQSGLPVDALLMYGQKRDYEQGQRDPTDMLRWDDSVFVPIRSARIVAAARTLEADARSDVLRFHLQLRGFIDPDADLVKELVCALEAANSLPFGDRDTQYSWIALLPDVIRSRAATLISDDQRRWSSVVDKLVTLRTQFHDDVFWRVTEIKPDKSGANAASSTLSLRDRKTNVPADANRWHRDYVVDETKKYEICVQTHTPPGQAQQFPAGATIAMTTHDDDEGLIKLSTNPITLRPNATSCQRFSIDTDNGLDTRYAGIQLETQIPNRTSPYRAGSTCTVTFAIRKQRWRFLLGIICLLGAAFLVGYTAGVESEPLIKGGLGAGAVLLTAIGGWFLTRQFKLTTKSDA